MRDEVLMELVGRAIEDEDFLRRAREDPRAAVQEAGFDLDHDEMSAVMDLHREILHMSDEELQDRLTKRQGPGG